jgi:hypothetical protein
MAKSVATGFLWIAAACGGAGGGGGAAERPEEAGVTDTTIESAQQQLTDSLLTKPGVAGTAIGLCDDTPCIKVYLTRRDEELQAMIPDSIHGFKVDVEITGEFRARDVPE